MKMKKSLTAVLVVSAIGGCKMLSTASDHEVQIVSEWANRPIVDKIVPMPSEQPVFVSAQSEVEQEVDHGNEWFTDGFESELSHSDAPELNEVESVQEPDVSPVNDVLAKVDIAVLEPKKAEVEHSFFEKKVEAEPKHSYIAQTSTYILEGTDTYSFMGYEGETYRSVLSRWLSDQGYGVIGWYLDDLQQAMIDVPLKESIHMVTTLDAAVDELFESVRDEEVHFDGDLVSLGEKEDAFIELRLNADAKEAVVTSKKMPTTIFHVEPGSLRDNFVRLGAHYGWNVKSDFYLASDYNVKFGYPIVSEEGNVRVGLEKLLAPFSPLRGALVPSVREIYVVQEER